jgi:spermidine synthase
LFRRRWTLAAGANRPGIGRGAAAGRLARSDIIGARGDMTQDNPEPSSGRAAPEQWLPVLLLLFVGSGAAALIYEIVWFQLLQLVIGSSAVSMAVILGTFMGGMCLGSLLLPRLVSARHHPLRVYALLELGIGVIGIVLLFLMPLVGRLYTAWAGQGIAGFVARGLVAAVCLLPPTVAMGATLPAVARWVETTPVGVSWLGFFYAGNIAGAVFGSLLAGFYLLRVFDMTTATCVAAGVNAAVALVGLTLASVTAPGTTGRAAGETPPASSRAPGTAVVYLVIALSGFSALAAEVIWTRLLGLLFGASVYTFSIILAVFLIGLGIGSSVGSMLSRTLARPRVALGWCQMLIVGAIAWSAAMLADSLPYWPVNPSIASSVWFNFQIDLARALWAILPATILWGASFPLALAAVASKGQDPGRLVGGVYAANTIGAVVGALGSSLLLVAWIGSQHAQQVMMGMSALAGLLALAPAVSGKASDAPKLPWGRSVALIVALGLAGMAIRTVPRVPALLVAYGRYAATWMGQAGDIFYVGEGLNSSVAVSRLSDGALNYHNAGKIQASSQPQDMRLERMLGHLTTLVPKNPRSVMVIGCGAGVTAGAASIDPRVERLTIVEIEPLVPHVVATYFGAQNFNVIRNPKVHVHIDDARHYLFTTREKFDAITSDPLDPWVKGAATLYTKEFFELARQHLNPGGVVTLFVQLYESSPEAVKSEIATFFDVFPNGVIWGNTHQGKGYDTVMLGQAEPTRINVDEIDERLSRAEYAEVAKSLREVGLDSAVSLFANYAGRAPDLKEWLRDASINRDRNLRLQYLAGLGLNLYQSDKIYSDLLIYRKFPEDLFTGSAPVIQSLRWAITEHALTSDEP